MANDLAGRPWTLDTTAADFSSPTNSWKTWVHIEHIEFADYTLQADTCQLVDFNGRVIWEGHGTDDGTPDESFKVGWVQGCRLAQLSSGKVRVYIK